MKTVSRRTRFLGRACWNVVESLEKRQLLAGGDPDPSVIDPDLYETNNSFAEATDLGVTTNLVQPALTIDQDSGPDVDYFKFTSNYSGPVEVGITFAHSKGNLRLDVFNSAQQLIGSSNTSTTANGHEDVGFAAVAGQSYFVKVSGVSITVTSPDYSLRILQMRAQFDWTMPSRFGVLRDQYGLSIIQNTPDYTRPNPVSVNGNLLSTFGVHFDGTGTIIPGATGFTWHIQNSFWDQTLNSSGLALDTNLPEGVYTVTLTGTAAGNLQVQTTQTIRVEDHLIVAMGDSYGSGEGNPHQIQQYDFFGNRTAYAVWAQGLDAATTAAHRRAHRSSYAGVVQAALQLEQSDPKSSVTLVFLDHTGATIEHGILGNEDSGDPNEPGGDSPQIDQMTYLVGNRHVDSLVLSIGGNDAGFTEIAGRLVVADPDDSNYTQELAQIWADADTYRAALVNTWYPMLFNRLRQLDIGQVMLTEYPDPTTNSNGELANQILDDIVTFREIDHNELQQVKDKVMTKLGIAMGTFAATHKWTYVGNIASQFRGHGYGDWFYTATQATYNQGPLDNSILEAFADKSKTTGTLHPTQAGQNVYRDRLLGEFSLPDLTVKNFSITPNAFLPGASDGYTITVVNNGLASAGASVTRLYLSPDVYVDGSDTFLVDVNIPALGPGESYTVSGVFPVMSDPYRTAANLDFILPYVDFNNAVAENDEQDNIPVGVSDLATIAPDRDIKLVNTPSGPTTAPNAPLINLGPTYTGKLGIDEFIGAYDMDFYEFDVAAGQRVAFDIDAVSGGLNTFISIYALYPDGSIDPFGRLASNDDGRAPGEPAAQNGESYLRYTFANGGRYILVVSSKESGDSIPMLTGTRSAGGTGDYTLTAQIIDSVPPKVITASFDYTTAKPQVKVTFSEDVSGSLSAAALQVMNLTTNQGIGSASIKLLSYDKATNTAIFTFPGLSGGMLADGNYRATLTEQSVVDTDGNALMAGFGLNFFVLAGDANHDRSVNFADLVAVAQNYGAASGVNFAKGDFNYDGKVDFADLVVVAQKYGTWLSAPAALPALLNSAGDGVSKPLFSVTPIARPLVVPPKRDTRDGAKGLSH